MTYISKKNIVVFLLGVSSGLPFLLILSTLSAWLSEAGLSRTSIGLLAWVTIPYSLKCFWGPIIDTYKIPFFYQWFGRRRSWMLISQIMILLSILFLAKTHPEINLIWTALAALSVGFFSALQDICVETYRTEILSTNQISYGVSYSVLGYRLGMLVSGAGTMYLADIFGNWCFAYYIIALFMTLGIGVTLVISEPYIPNFDIYSINTKWLYLFRISWYKFFQIKQIHVVIAFVIAFRLTDTILNVMSMPFLISIGFSKIEIANIAKTFGIISMMLGGLLAGTILQRASLWQLLVICAIMQSLSCILFVIQAKLGHHLNWLWLTIGIENLICGIGQVALIVYFSNLCKGHYTATHYALLSSFASFMRINFSIASGFLADIVSWHHFYSIIALLSLPAVFILLYYHKHFCNLLTKDEGPATNDN